MRLRFLRHAELTLLSIELLHTSDPLDEGREMEWLLDPHVTACNQLEY
jgi:hypothetical protein